MIKEFEFYHGVVFSKLIHESKNIVSVKKFSTDTNASYILNENIGLFIKHSAKRMSPWRFSFLKEHQDEIQGMKIKLPKVFLLLVCGDDGIVTLEFEEVKKILDDSHDPVEWISVTRVKNTEYTIKGSDGTLGYKISRKDLFRKLLQS